jgi:exopolyphosphatase/guanosine-5'-triphosphate,3'-diphosphate pyrophosphatase
MTTGNVAAIDIGTNSVRLLVTDADGNELERHMKITRLGQDVDVTGSLQPDAIDRTVSVLKTYRERIVHFGADRIRATATSAARDADNQADFFDEVEAALGSRPELLPGEEEARLSFRGATFGIDGSDGPFLVVDIGGGSTEFVVGTTEPEALTSVKMGCVRMTERHLKSDPPTRDELVACFTDVKKTLAEVRSIVDVTRAKRMIGLAGTITSMAALTLGLTEYDPKKTHHALVTRTQIEDTFARLASSSLEERRGLLIQPERAEVIVGGGAVLVTLLREFDIQDFIVSESDILDGLAASLR